MKKEVKINAALIVITLNLFIISTIKAQNSRAARIDSVTGKVIYVRSNKPVAVEETKNEPGPSVTPLDTFKVTPSAPYRPTSPADRLRLEKYRHQNIQKANTEQDQPNKQ